jgi:hypothetical protein
MVQLVSLSYQRLAAVDEIKITDKTVIMSTDKTVFILEVTQESVFMELISVGIKKPASAGLWGLAFSSVNSVLYHDTYNL